MPQSADSAFVHRTVANADGVTIVYRDFGRRDGRTIVLCHGLAANGGQFTADAAYFAKRGYRVLVPDLRGHGESGAPEGRKREDFAIDRLAADMIAMLDDAGATSVDWVGNSLGGIVALAMLGSAPERFRTFATFGTAYSLSLPAFGAYALPWVYSVFGRHFTSAMTAKLTTRNRAAQALIRDMLFAFDPEVGRATAENAARYDFIAIAERFPRPILLLRGGRDTQVNAALGPTLRAMRQHANFTVVELKEGGHCANLDATDPWRAALLAFWERG